MSDKENCKDSNIINIKKNPLEEKLFKIDTPEIKDIIHSNTITEYSDDEDIKQIPAENIISYLNSTNNFKTDEFPLLEDCKEIDKEKNILLNTENKIKNCSDNRANKINNEIFLDFKSKNPEQNFIFPPDSENEQKLKNDLIFLPNFNEVKNDLKMFLNKKLLDDEKNIEVINQINKNETFTKNFFNDLILNKENNVSKKSLIKNKNKKKHIIHQDQEMRMNQDNINNNKIMSNLNNNFTTNQISDLNLKEENLHEEKSSEISFSKSEKISIENLSDEEDNNCPKNKKNKDSFYKTGRWTNEEHSKFLEAIFIHSNSWKKVQEHIKSRSSTQARSHAQKFFISLKKKFSEENNISFFQNDINEDKVKDFITEFLENNFFNKKQDNNNNFVYKDQHFEERREKLSSLIFSILTSNAKNKKSLFKCIESKEENISSQNSPKNSENIFFTKKRTEEIYSKVENKKNKKK